MTRIFEAWRMEGFERRQGAATGQMTDWQPKDTYLVVQPEAEDYIDEMVGERFDIAAFFFLCNLTRDPETWAAVFFSDVIEDSDEVLRVRAELRDDIRFAPYGRVEPGMSNPPLGAMAITSPEALEAASSRHEVFRKAWDILQACSADKNWVAVVEL